MAMVMKNGQMDPHIPVHTLMGLSKDLVYLSGQTRMFILEIGLIMRFKVTVSIFGVMANHIVDIGKTIINMEWVR